MGQPAVTRQSSHQSLSLAPTFVLRIPEMQDIVKPPFLTVDK